MTSVERITVVISQWDLLGGEEAVEARCLEQSGQTRDELTDNFFEYELGDFTEDGRLVVARTITDRMIETIPEADRSEKLLRVIRDTAFAALGLQPLPQAQEGEE